MAVHRFGPGLLTYLGSLIGVGLVAAFLWARGTEPESWKALLGGIVILAGTLPGWNWYRLDGDGIHRRGLSGAKFVPWTLIDTVRGRRVERAGRAGVAISQVVLDAQGCPLLRLGPWIHRRREMARLIRTTIAARRRDDAPRDE